MVRYRQYKFTVYKVGVKNMTAEEVIKILKSLVEEHKEDVDDSVVIALCLAIKACEMATDFANVLTRYTWLG